MGVANFPRTVCYLHCKYSFFVHGYHFGNHRQPRTLGFEPSISWSAESRCFAQGNLVGILRIICLKFFALRVSFREAFAISLSGDEVGVEPTPTMHIKATFSFLLGTTSISSYTGACSCVLCLVFMYCCLSATAVHPFS